VPQPRGRIQLTPQFSKRLHKPVAVIDVQLLRFMKELQQAPSFDEIATIAFKPRYDCMLAAEVPLTLENVIFRHRQVMPDHRHIHAMLLQKEFRAASLRRR
jgi:hypothetical protein